MPQIIYEGDRIFLQPGESVLDAFLRQGISIPFSCRNGICHVCMQRCTSGIVAPEARKGLSPDLQQKGYFLACKCIPADDMAICSPDRGDIFVTALVQEMQKLTPNVCKLQLELTRTLTYRAGQFINIRHGELVRSYSLASLPEETCFLEIHVQRMENGAMSNWIFNELKAGDALDIQGPYGDCSYMTTDRDQPLLLVGHGTGLAPLIGVARDALHNHHSGEIHLYHGSHDFAGLYLRHELLDLQDKNANFHYHECLSRQSAREGIAAGRAVDIAFASRSQLDGWGVYLAGAPEMVAAGERQALDRGARPSDIHTDYFALGVLQAQRGNAKVVSEQALSRVDDATSNAGDRKEPLPDPELWSALGNGELLTEILTDFYGRVFRDPRLSSFFVGTTEQRLVEKQYSFLHQLLSGKKVYFGDRPRNAHHWMVISEELFDYREELMVRCMCEHGIPERFAHRLRAIERFYRKDIVKSSPWNRIMNGTEIQRDGFGDTVMDVGAICDACGHEVAAGEHVRYHLRLGSIYCANCS